ncbi:MAG: methyl-accepting chemotaxis protein [Lachnospiraceae bacterium]
MKMKGKLVCMIMIPLLISSLAIGIISVNRSESYLNGEQKTILQVALEGFDGDVNAFKDQNIDITVFEGDTRKTSSIQGVEGTKASDIVIQTVINGKQDYFDTNVDVHGVAYYGYYIPTETGMLFAGKTQEVVQKSLSQLLFYIVGIGGVFLLASGIVGFFLAKYMAKQIEGVAVNIGRVADGDLTIGDEIVPTASKDEINGMNRSTKHMVEALSSIIHATSNISGSIDKSSEELNRMSDTTLASMGEVSNAIDKIASGLQSQNAATQTIADNVSNIDQDIDEINVSANDILTCSTKLDESNRMMKQKMITMSESNEKVNKSIGGLSDKMQEISRVIEDVKGIASVIGDISAQTKLLSLNAAIEAARAGEMGKGFAVVANSISELSEDTSHQVTEITTIIDTLVSDFTECIEVIDETVTDGNEQKEDIVSVADEFEHLSGDIEETAKRVHVIGASVEKAVSRIAFISQEVEELVSISENCAESTQQVNQSVEEMNTFMKNVSGTVVTLKREAEELNQKMEFFKV